MIDDIKELVKLFFETGMLNRLERAGDLLVGNENPQNVAEHSFRAAIIGYFLAKLEKADSDKVIKALLFHDLAECRILELNKVASRYLNRQRAEKAAFSDQLKSMPKSASNELKALMQEMDEGKTKEAKIAKDADYLECAVSAKEAIEKGIDMKDWINNIKKALKTNNAKKMLNMIEKTPSNEWWKNLKYIPEINKGDKKY